MQWYDLGNAFLMNSLPFGGVPTFATYNLDPSGPEIGGITGPVLAFVDDLDPNGDQYPDYSPTFSGNLRPIDPGSLIWIGGTTYTVTNVWHSAGATITTTSGTYGGGIHYFEISDGVNTLYIAFPNRFSDLIDPADVIAIDNLNGIVDWITLGASASGGWNSVIPNYLGGNQGTPTDPPCFAAGTRILTPRGEVPIEALAPGDLVETLQHGPLPLAWIGRVWGGRGRLARSESWRPWRIEAGRLGPGLPARPVVLSAQHRLLVGGPDVARIAGSPAVLAAVKHLAALPGIARMGELREVEFFHLLFDRHAVVRADGAWAESLWPGPVVSQALEAAALGAPEALCARVRGLGPALPLADGRLGRRIARRLAKTGAAAQDPAALAALSAAARPVRRVA